MFRWQLFFPDLDQNPGVEKSSLESWKQIQILNWKDLEKKQKMHVVAIAVTNVPFEITNATI